MKKHLMLILPIILIVSACGNANSNSEISPIKDDEIKGLVGSESEILLEGYSEVKFRVDNNELCSHYIENSILHISFENEGQTNYYLTLQDKSFCGVMNVYDFSIVGNKSTILNYPVNLSTTDEKKKFVWSSSNESVATIENGKLYPHKIGSTRIGITYDDVTSYLNFEVIEEYKTLNKFHLNDEFVNFYGRNEFKNDYVNFNNGASGFDVKFYGTSISFTMAGWAASYYGSTRIGYVLDEENDYNEHYFILDGGSSKKEYNVVSSLAEGYHKIKIFKRTESGASEASIFKITTDGFFVKADNKQKLKIESYGDSITAGYGNLRLSNQGDGNSAELQNTYMTYECQAAILLNAQINVMARSGIGLSVAANVVGDYNMNTKYEYVTPLSNTKYNMHNYIPDIVTINLGTNDFWSGKFDKNTFINEYVRFISNLNKAYGDDVKYIICCGFMEKNVYPILHNEVYVALIENGFTNVYPLEFEITKSNGHPLMEEHKEAGKALAEKITEIS